MNEDILNIKFSVLITVYIKEKPRCLAKSIDSVYQQTLPPTEVVLVADGPLAPELDQTIAEYQEKYPTLVVYRLEKNVGLGDASNFGLDYCKYDYIARMDSDDVSLPDRFEKQLKCFLEDKDLAVCGGVITEFVDYYGNIISRRVCPNSDEEIKKYLKRRCPFNHMTVMFRKSELLRVGGYQDWYWNEDYYLWVRMALEGCKFINLDDVLVNVRVGKDMYARRGGKEYFNSERKLQKYMLVRGMISYPEYCLNVLLRKIVQIYMPNTIRSIFYKKLLRKS